jgi:hypothetical protein
LRVWSVQLQADLNMVMYGPEVYYVQKCLPWGLTLSQINPIKPSPDDGGSKYLWNVCQLYMAQHPRKQLVSILVALITWNLT